MGKVMDMTGSVSGRLTAVRMLGKNEKHQMLWECACQCGALVVKAAREIKAQSVRSCGCLHMDRMRDQTHNLKHGHSLRRGARRASPTYLSWRSMIGRCGNPNDPAFARYGARGITVCPEWSSFEQFLADMGERPDGTSIDRIDNDRGYEPGNCRWATATTQNRNSRSCRLTVALAQEILGRLEHGEILASVARRMGISIGTASKVANGETWSDLPPLAARRSRRHRSQIA